MTGPQTLPAVLRDAADRFGEKAAVVDGDTTLTFTDLLGRVRTTARGYIGLGLEVGDRVCVWAPNSWRWEVAALAVSYAGGTLVPLNTRYTGHEALDVVRRSGARIVVVAEGFLDRSMVEELEAAGAQRVAIVDLLDSSTPTPPERPGGPQTNRVVGWSELVVLADETPPEVVEERASAVSPDDVADILFTSGTTGRSKGACSAHRQTVGVARVWGELAGIVPEDRYLVVNPFFHSFGYKAGIVVGLLYGTAVLPQAVFDVEETLRLVETQMVTVLPGAPAVYHSLLEAPGLSHADLSSLRVAVTGAAVVPAVLVERMQADLCFDTVLTAFGMTEAVVATMCRRGDPIDVVASTCGSVVPGMEMRIARPGTNDAVPAGEEGELLFRGDSVMLGYLDDAEATAEAIDPHGWLHTGDIGRVDERGYLTVTDRLKDMYICGGFNVYPAEVEQALARLGGVVESAVVGVHDERLGEVGKAYVVRRAGAGLTEAEVVDFARERLANFKVPRVVEFVDVLPRNASGKVLKRTLRSQG